MAIAPPLTDDFIAKYFSLFRTDADNFFISDVSEPLMFCCVALCFDGYPYCCDGSFFLMTVTIFVATVTPLF